MGTVSVIGLLFAVPTALPAIAQEGALRTPAPAAISPADSIPSVRDAYESDFGAPGSTKPVGDDVPDEVVEPRVIARTFLATAYCLKGRTASGLPVRRGIIAADPKILPLGSVVRLRAGQYSGIYTVMDTGGSVRGQRIDIFLPTRAEAVRFGARKVRLEVLRHGWDPDPQRFGTM